MLQHDVAWRTRAKALGVQAPALVNRLLRAESWNVHAGDLISEIALAIEMGADAVDIGKTIHPHPTLGESIGLAAEAFEGTCTDLPPVRR